VQGDRRCRVCLDHLWGDGGGHCGVGVVVAVTVAVAVTVVVAAEDELAGSG
jgi:hypothetical protein